MRRALEGLQIVVAENDLDNLELLQYFLTSEGAKVAIARDAREAREHLRENQPDVLISDLALRYEDGYTLVASVRADPCTHGMPAIAVTGYSDGESLQRALESGFNCRLVKPIDLFALMDAIRTLVPSAPIAVT